MLPFRDYNPSRSFPLVTLALIAVNVLVFLYMLSLSAQGGSALAEFYRRAAVVPYYYTHGGSVPREYIDPFWLSTLTAMFMHGGFIHLAGNMLFLWIFGNNVEDIMGPARYLSFYLLCGIIATAVQIASAPVSKVPALGASGAIAGVLGAYLVRFPNAQVDTCVFFFFITVIRLPALIVLAFWFVLQFFQGVASLTRDPSVVGGVAYWAHIGGFLAGMLLVAFFAKRPRTQYS